MSYILDALKKSEKDRQRGRVPDVLTVQDMMKREPKKRSVWPYLFIVVLLLNAGAFVWWLGHSQSRKPEMAEESTNAGLRESRLIGIPDSELTASQSTEKSKTVGTGVREAAKDMEYKTKSITTAVKTAKAADARQEQPIATEAGSGVKSPDKPAPVDERRLHQGVPSVPQQSTTAKHLSDVNSMSVTAIAPDGRVVDLKDLPPSIEQSLPAFAISVSVYSDDPGSRMVKVNGQMLQEGQYLTDGLKLDEIAPNGVIFSYQNYRFRVELR